MRTPHTTISLLLSDVPAADTVLHIRSTPYVSEAFPDREPCSITTITVGALTLQWDQPEHAEAWLRDALAKVEVAKIDAANDQPAPLLPERVSNEACGAEMAWGVPGVDEVVWTCVRPAGHDGLHVGGVDGLDEWGEPYAPAFNALANGVTAAPGKCIQADCTTCANPPAARIGEPLDLTAVAL